MSSRASAGWKQKANSQRGHDRGRGRYRRGAARAPRASEPQMAPRISTIGQGDSNNLLRQHHRYSAPWDSGWTEPLSSSNKEPLGPRRKVSSRLDEPSPPRRLPSGTHETGSSQRPQNENVSDHVDDTVLLAPSIGPTSEPPSCPRSPSQTAATRDEPRTAIPPSGDDRVSDMAPMPATPREPEQLAGPNPSLIEVARPYVFEEGVRSALDAVGMPNSREDQIRMNGVLWIDQVRRVLQLPVKTFNTAVVYYHKFRLLHHESEYVYKDAAIAALFCACKIEDTLKKSKEILCAATNIQISDPQDYLSPDDPVLEAQSKTVIGLERLMLEASGFDFRNRQPQQLVVKLAQSCNFTRRAALTAHNICMDLYSTFAPLKQTTWTLAVACVELAARLHPDDVDLSLTLEDGGINYDKYKVDRSEVMETLLDALDMYTHFRVMTTIGKEFPLDTFISITIDLKQECDSKRLPRFTESPSLADVSISPKAATNNKATTNGVRGSPTSRNGTSPSSPAEDGRNRRRPSERDTRALNTPSGVSSPAVTSPSETRPGQRGQQSGTIRFMLDNRRAAEERDEVDRYYRDEYEEVEEMQEVTDDTAPTPRNNIRNNNNVRPRREEDRNGGPAARDRERVDRRNDKDLDRHSDRGSDRGGTRRPLSRERERDRREPDRRDPRDRDPRDREPRDVRRREEDYDRDFPPLRPRERERERDREFDRRDRERDFERRVDPRDRRRDDFDERRYRDRYDDRRR